MSRNLDRAMTRFARIAEPTERLELLAAADGVVDRSTRRLTSPALADTHDPQTITWDPSDTGGDFAVRAGTATLIRAYATTAPTTGDALITITNATQFSGAETLGVVTIPQGSNWGTLVLAMPVDAGAYFSRAVTTANGASGITIQLVMKAG